MRKSRFLTGGGLVALLLFVPHVGLAQPSSDEFNKLRQEVESLKAGQKAISNDVQEIKKLLSSRGNERSPIRDIDTTIHLSDAFSRGDTHAQLTLIEFTDYQCPFCAKHVRETLPKLEKEYIETGKLRYVTRDFPLENIHKIARKAAEAFWCASEQGKGEEMHDRLFANQQQLQSEALGGHAQTIGLDVLTFQACLDSGKYTAKIDASLKEGQNAGVTGTPAFFLGYTQADGAEVKAVKFLSGALPFTTFKDNIDKLIDAKR
jgi:protein-disulfide isomerase